MILINIKMAIDSNINIVVTEQRIAMITKHKANNKWYKKISNLNAQTSEMDSVLKDQTVNSFMLRKQKVMYLKLIIFNKYLYLETKEDT